MLIELDPAAAGSVRPERPVDKTFRRYDQDQPMLLAPDLRDWLPADHPARWGAALPPGPGTGSRSPSCSPQSLAFVEKRGWCRWDGLPWTARRFPRRRVGRRRLLWRLSMARRPGQKRSSRRLPAVTIRRRSPRQGMPPKHRRWCRKTPAGLHRWRSANAGRTAGVLGQPGSQRRRRNSAKGEPEPSQRGLARD